MNPALGGHGLRLSPFDPAVLLFFFFLLLSQSTRHDFTALHATKSMEKSIKLELLSNFATLP